MLQGHSGNDITIWCYLSCRQRKILFLLYLLLYYFCLIQTNTPLLLLSKCALFKCNVNVLIYSNLFPFVIFENTLVYLKFITYHTMSYDLILMINLKSNDKPKTALTCTVFAAVAALV